METYYQRLKKHLNNEHSQYWSHFSAYPVIEEEDTSDIEAIVSCYSSPEGISRLYQVVSGIRKLDLYTNFGHSEKE